MSKYIVELYQLKISKRWRWKLSSENGRVLARADHHYGTRHQALRSWENIQNNLLGLNNKVSVAIWRKGEVVHWKDIV